MALIIETGALIANANSYVTVVEARAYALARGVTLSATDSDVERYLVLAMDYLESLRAKFQGTKVSSTQSLQWPRTDVLIDCIEFPETSIPVELKNAQMQLAMQVSNGVDLMPTRQGAFVKLEKVGPIETQYSEKIGTGLTPDMTAVDMLIAPLLSSCGQSFALKSVRV